jgi:hypothetical protein
MVTIIHGEPKSQIIDSYEALSECYFNITKQEMHYEFDTHNHDWVCVRTEGEWAYELRY